MAAASFAEAITASASASSATTIRPVTCPVAGSVTSRVFPDDPACSWPPNQWLIMREFCGIRRHRTRFCPLSAEIRAEMQRRPPLMGWSPFDVPAIRRWSRSPPGPSRNPDQREAGPRRPRQASVNHSWSSRLSERIDSSQHDNGDHPWSGWSPFVRLAGSRHRPGQAGRDDVAPGCPRSLEGDGGAGGLEGLLGLLGDFLGCVLDHRLGRPRPGPWPPSDRGRSGRAPP